MIRVLVVEDSRITSDMVSGYLQDKGFDVQVVDKPLEVIDRLKRFRPQVMLLDLGLPVLAGEELLRLVNGCLDGLDLRVVLFSSADEKKLKGIVERGLAHDYFTKGLSLVELEKKILAQAGMLVKTAG